MPPQQCDCLLDFTNNVFDFTSHEFCPLNCLQVIYQSVDRRSSQEWASPAPPLSQALKQAAAPGIKVHIAPFNIEEGI